jgi:glycosidase
MRSPEWIRSAVLYQINTRHFTPEGTFSAASRELPRLRGLGVDVVWLTPVHPIGERNRKGALGSPYSVRNHRAVNPEFGSLDELKAFVARAHDLGLRVILDWVVNHTAWDHHLVEEHPEWYARDWKGDFRPTPWWDWSDVIDLDYRADGVADWMIDAMAFWVREVDVDGFRCDVAGFVPTGVWERARRALEALKPVFLLAEWEDRELHRAAFDASYAWSWYEAVRDIARGRADVTALYKFYSWHQKAWPAHALRMTHVENHDRNAWEGSQFELFGDALEAAVVLSVVGRGMPLLHNGQEAGNPRRLAFFERDPIDWRPHPLGDLYRDLFALKHGTRALWNGVHGAEMVRVANDAEPRVLSFVRLAADDGVFAIFNFSDRPAEVGFGPGPHRGEWTRVLNGDGSRGRPDPHPGATKQGPTEVPVLVEDAFALTLPPWGWQVHRRGEVVARARPSE